MSLDELIQALQLFKAAGKDRVYVNSALSIISVDTDGQGDVRIFTTRNPR